jgi:hypothetical protein
MGINKGGSMNKKKHFDPRKASIRVSKIILRKHFAWCKKEGRDISWYQAENKPTSEEFKGAQYQD